jgi:hypothetical protein
VLHPFAFGIGGDAQGAHRGELTNARRGRRPSTSARALELIALQLFRKHGFEQTTVRQIARTASCSTISYPAPACSLLRG